MKIQAIFENGVFRPVQPLVLKHSVVTIQVPDEEIANTVPHASEEVARPTYSLPPEAAAYSEQLKERLDRIRNAPLPDDASLPPLTQKQIERIEAFSLRDEIRGER